MHQYYVYWERILKITENQVKLITSMIVFIQFGLDLRIDVLHFTLD